MLRTVLGRTLGRRTSTGVISRSCSTTEELAIANKITSGLTGSTVKVQDTSGGCGTMFSINVVSEHFSGKTVPQQHQIVRQLLKEDIPKWHGWTLNTKKPS